MTYIITKALAPIFLILLLGYWAGKAKLVDNANVSILNIFLMDFSLPAALFLATVMTPWAGIYRQLPLVAELTLAMWWPTPWSTGSASRSGRSPRPTPRCWP